jgi:hypothetical protein
MWKLSISLAATFLACHLGRTAQAADPAPPTKEGLDFFEAKIRPVLVQQCYECHSEVKKKIKGKLRVDDLASLLKGGESGKPSIVPGDPDKSLLITAIVYEDKDTDSHDALLMPPPKNGKPRKLPANVINNFKQWIKMGAPYPRAAHAQASPADPKQHWAFVSPREPAIPQVKQTSWARNAIDRFVLAKLEAQNLHPSNPADKRTLIRRATFDLTGLPPTDAQVRAFEADSSADAYANVIDRLLASKHYGERWGRYWLDVARYSDTKGYVFEEERRYPYSYTYRDWVINALNDDLPYDQFLIDQIAADRLDLKGDNSALAAEGFLTLGRRFLNNQSDIIDDRIDVLCRGTMAMTVGCARCHDHKFDPIPQKDYYALYAVFNNSPESKDLPLIGKPGNTPGFKQFTEELARKEQGATKYARDRFAEHLALLRTSAQIAGYMMSTRSAQVSDAGPVKPARTAKADAITPFMTARWKSYLNNHSSPTDSIFAAWNAYAAIPESDFAARSADVTANVVVGENLNPLIHEAFETTPPASLREVAERYGKAIAACDASDDREYPQEEELRNVLRSPISPTSVSFEERTRVFTVQEGQRERTLHREIEAFKVTDPGAPPRAMALQDSPSRAPQNIFLRGNPGNPGPLVKPAFLTALSPSDEKPFAKGSGRLELAEHIASKENPLTARVMVNRIWMHHFGKGLVRTPSDFGLRSDPPTHPELLDYLAMRFMEGNWSIKNIHRLIMLSATYQQSSDTDESVARSDPDNMLISHFNRQRLDWEATRDALLEVSGRLDPAMGGRSVEVLDSSRRTVYGFIDRQNLPGVFRAFDFASPDATSAQRFTTTVPQQALFLMNSPFAVREAKELMKRPEIAQAVEPSERINRMYALAYQRQPTADELASGLKFVSSETSSKRLNLWEQYAQVLLESNEFVFVD